ncbi:hypothetical protein PGT21_030234 [Puccinia graminis f. sp. tritici]|uniref:Uncharacterized protein n=1 Tax=Puccinia graminis f. sp. tritici TaxID=56615 RepID=A0A5B0P3Z7_PUCGR|nr:hypothetical protein PGTUg99_020300 [Puccinia graminis f. sp. tritici]KAA1094789.1 hypothetical protein PGT21_030234 [Puccinia graminis f. sp. tritici]
MNTLSSGGVSPDERVCTPARREESLPASWIVYQLAGRDSSRRAGMNTLSSGGVSPERLTSSLRASSQLVGRNPSRREGIHPSSSGGTPPGELDCVPARREESLPAVLPLLAPGIPWDTRISARFGRKNSHPQPKPHPLAGIRWHWRNCINMSSESQPKTTTAKTYSEAVSASEGTRSEPSKTVKTTSKTTSKRPKKQPKSPEEVPSEWDKSNLSSKSEKPKIKETLVKKPLKSKVDNAKENTVPISNDPVAPPISTEQVSGTRQSKTKDPLPTTDPFKSKEKISKLIDKDSISHLTFKKIDQEPLKGIETASPSKTITNNTSDQSSRIVKPPSPVNSVSEAAKTLLNSTETFNEPVDRLTQKKLDNYFVPQGQTVRSVSLRSSDHPDSSNTSSSSVIQSDGRDLDIITGATTQLWSRHKTLPAPLEEDTLLRYPPAYHPLLQAVKLNQEYYQSLKVVALRAAANLQTDLLHSISQEEFLRIFKWNPTSEFKEYSKGEKGRQFLKERGTEVTPTPPPEVQMQPPDTEKSQEQRTENLPEYQPQPPMYYHLNGYYYPYPPEMYNQQNPSWNQTGYYYNNQNYPVAQQQPLQENLQPQAPQQPPGSSSQKNQNDQAPKSNRNRPRNRKAKGPNWVPPPTLKRAPETPGRQMPGRDVKGPINSPSTKR